MDFSQLVSDIFQICIIPLLGILTAFFSKWVSAKISEISAKEDNALLSKYLDMLNSTIVDCVKATNQTYVESLKAQGKFNADAQKEAFKRTSEAVFSILTQDMQEYLSSALGDLEVYVKQKIEAEVNSAKGQN